MRVAPALLLVPLLLAGCGDGGKADAAAQAARREAEAAPALQRYHDAMTGQDWDTARVAADELRFDYKGTKAEAEVSQGYDALRAKSDHMREDKDMAALWNYQDNPADGGHQLTAMIHAKDPVDVGGSPSSVQLIFRDHPSWGNNAYMILEHGDFDCWKGCKLKVTTADGKVHVMPGLRPDTKEAISMFVNDVPGLWKLAKTSKTVSIEFPVKPSGTRTAVFVTGGLDPTQMRNWK